MFSRFFIDRPIFASVLSIVVTLAGAIALLNLPIAQYPEITPPTVEVSASYPGANAQVVADTVAAPVEQQVNGVEGMMYMSSQCTNDGTYTLSITFKLGTDLNIAQVLVQNRVALAQPILPDLVKRRGITVKKKSPSQLMIVNLYSPKGTRNSLDLSNYATIQLRDELARLPGIGDITYLGQRDYSMRIWLDPQKMAARNISASDVVNAVQQQNAQVAAGQIGQPPVPRGQAFQFTLTTRGRLADPEQFQEMILKTNVGRLIRLRDVVVSDTKDLKGVELGAQSYDQVCWLDGRDSVALSVYQLPGSNALDVARSVRERMQDLRQRFPDDIEYDIVYDTTPFIQESINEVFNTLRDAVILVAVVVLLFLQNWRSAVIPLVAVPVAIIGTFAVMSAAGFSLNNLTLFGLVLAIGIVVDDAIVVVEAVEHHIEHGMAPRDATIRAMEQVSGPVIAVGLVLSAVFVPCAFITGITGQFFRQFALTIAVSTVISAFNSLTLSPALAALLLKPRAKNKVEPLPRFAFVLILGWVGYQFGGPLLQPHVNSLFDIYVPADAEEAAEVAELTRQATLAAGIAGALIGAVLGWVFGNVLKVILAWAFRVFNQGFDMATGWYARSVGRLLRVSVLVLLVYGGLLALTYGAFRVTPTGFIPAQDRGYLLVNLQLPDAASVERTQEAMKRIDEVARHTPGVKHTVAVSGQSIVLGANGPNYGAMYVMLDDFHHRTGPGMSSDEIAARLEEALRKAVPDGQVNLFGAPPVEGLGTSGGFKIVIEDRGDIGMGELQSVADQVVEDGNAGHQLQGLFTSFRANTPWLYLDIDREKAETLGVSMAEVFNTLQVNLGSLYVNDFNKFGRTWQVTAQAAPGFRQQASDIRLLEVRNSRGSMVPLGTLMRVKIVTGPSIIIRYNMYQSATVNANVAPGVSSGQAIAALRQTTEEHLEPGMRTEWTELALLQLMTGNTAMYVFILAVVLVFLVLAAQYESWSLPLAVILVVPMCLLCAIAGVILARMDVNIFTQIGFVVLVGLACKNAILIVEYAQAQRESGVQPYEATLEACKLRLRPIMMTSFAFILGVLPLVISEGAGAEMRRALGTAVFSGMLGVTLFGIFLTPVFFYVIQRLVDRRAKAEGLEQPEPSADGHHPAAPPEHAHAAT